MVSCRRVSVKAAYQRYVALETQPERKVSAHYEAALDKSPGQDLRQETPLSNK